MADRHDGAAVTADALSLRGPRGWVYREVGLTAEPGALVALTGPPAPGAPRCCSRSPAGCAPPRAPPPWPASPCPPRRRKSAGSPRSGPSLG
ncbi:hypothetical protein [Kitasatospora paranensis]|uniref:hypothetical protein n=1 Tax=Kitasatospora paranensis TaxID=258053 RepID=UPI0031ECDF78